MNTKVPSFHRIVKLTAVSSSQGAITALSSPVVGTFGGTGDR